MTAPSPIVLEPAAQEVADAFSKRPFIYEKTPADARVRIIRPQGATGMLPVIVYMHGGGWILGNAETHDRLVRELAVGARAALAFADYPNSPEARYPTAIEQGYATAQWITRNGASKGLDASRMAVAGESVGGNMAAAFALMAKERADVAFVQQSLYYPVTARR
jgi:acetyl esterase/lipase